MVEDQSWLPPWAIREQIDRDYVGELGTDNQHQSPDASRIIVFGSDFVCATDVRPEYSWPRRLASKLGENWSIQAVCQHNADHSWIATKVLKTVLEDHPQAIVVIWPRTTKSEQAAEIASTAEAVRVSGVQCLMYSQNNTIAQITGFGYKVGVSNWITLSCLDGSDPITHEMVANQLLLYLLSRLPLNPKQLERPTSFCANNHAIDYHTFWNKFKPGITTPNGDDFVVVVSGDIKQLPRQVPDKWRIIDATVSDMAGPLLSMGLSLLVKAFHVDVLVAVWPKPNLAKFATERGIETIDLNRPKFNRDKLLAEFCCKEWQQVESTKSVLALQFACKIANTRLVLIWPRSMSVDNASYPQRHMWSLLDIDSVLLLPENTSIWQSELPVALAVS